MDLFEDLQQKLNCKYVSDLPKLWRTSRKMVAFIILTLDFKKYDISQWIDLCNFLQIPFSQSGFTDINKIRALFKRYA